MDLVKDGAPTHCHLRRKKFIRKNGDHCSAQQEILLDLIQPGPGDLRLVGHDILASQGGHDLSSLRWVLMRTDHCDDIAGGALDRGGLCFSRDTTDNLSGRRFATTRQRSGRASLSKT